MRLCRLLLKRGCVVRRLHIVSYVALIIVVWGLSLFAQGRGTPGGQTLPVHDSYFYMTSMNKASIVMLAETGIVPATLASQIARGIQEIDADMAKAGAKRTGDYLGFEANLVKVAGPDASRLHTGRSRQDMGATSGRMSLRDAILSTFESLGVARKSFLALAEQHQKTIIPGYTHGVQAQPTSLAHYLLALDAALERDAERFRSAYARTNLSPLGAAVLSTSGFPLDRKRLAVLLGFDGVVDNALDANHVSPAETHAEFAGALATSSIMVGHFVTDLHTQYNQPVPWITLKEGPLTGISSIMPQKRNPWAFERLRAASSTVMGDAQTVFIIEHNTQTGMSDYRQEALGQVEQAASRAAGMYRLLGDVVDNLEVHGERALAEVNADYSTTTELADSLLRLSNVPFRIGHHFASELTNFGRGRGMMPKDIPYVEAVRIYKSVTGGNLPLNEAQVKEALSAENMVFGRHGLGGPQLSEVKRMQAEHQTRLGSDMQWLKEQRDKLQAAETSLDRALRQVASKSTN
jgi:argininosuccinate lyase